MICLWIVVKISLVWMGILKGYFFLLLNSLIVFLDSQIEPVKPAIENAVGNTTTTTIKEVGYPKYALGNGSLDLKHLDCPF